MKTRKISQLLLVVVAWTGIIIILYLNSKANIDNNLVLSTLTIFSYFTVQSNVIVAIVSTYLLFKNENNRLLKLFEYGALINITITCITYHLLLRGSSEFSGAALAADIITHTIVPIFYVLNWLMFNNKNVINLKHLFVWLMYQAVYIVWTLIRGELDGYYPYPFVDAANLGYSQVALNSLFMALFFLITGIIYLKLNNYLAIKK